MNPLQLIRELASDVVVERLGWVLVHSLWQFTLIAFVAAIVVRLLGRNRAAARYAVLFGAMAALVVSPMATWFLQPEWVAIAEVAPVADGATAPIATGAAPAAARMNALDGEPADAALAVNLPAGELPAKPAPLAISDVPVAAPTPLTWAESVERTLRPWLAWIVVGWSLGVVLCSLRPLLGWHALWRLRRVGVSPVGEEISAALRRAAGQLGLRRFVQVLQSTLVQTPVLVGYFRPAILLPVGLATGLPIAQLEAILAHELAHVRRHDFLVNLLQTLLETLCFYHPAVWWLSRQIRVEREHCCDDLVVGLLGNRVEYGRALLAVEELRGTSSVLALGMADGVLLSRVRRLFGARSDLSAVRPGERWVVLALAALGLLVTLLGVRTGLNVGRDSDVEPAQFSATLPNGTIVELLGVATGEKDSPWWRPDGTPMNQPPLTGLPISTGFEPAKNCRSFAVRVRGAGSDDSWMVADGAKQFHSVGRGDPGGVAERVITTDVLPQQDLGTLRVGVERGEFGPPQPVSPAGRKIEVTLPEELRPWYDAVPLPRVEEVDGKVRLVFPPPDFSQHRHFVEWSVVDVDGNRSLTFDLPLSRVDRFEYRLQPRKHWVTFENVSLQPGRTSEVKVSTEPPPRPGAFVAKLPGDVAVELVGVGPHPAKDKPWWKPDGRPLEPRPTLEGGFSVMSGSPEQAQCREFLIHIRGLPREHAVTTDYGPVSAATGSSYSDGLWVGEHGAGPFKSGTTSVRVGLTTEPYGPTVEIDITGTRQPAELSADLQPFYDRIVPLRVEEVDGQTELILDGKASNNLFKEAAWELHAVDVDGEKHRRSSESVPRSGERHFTFKFPRNRIARFEYRVRPYRHWATFENVSLEPGKKTDVKVSVETVAAEEIVSDANTKVVEPIPVVTTKAGTWKLDGEVSLEIASRTLQGPNELLTATFRRPAADGGEPIQPVFGRGTGNSDRRMKWAAGWIPGSSLAWILTERPPAAKYKEHQIELTRIRPGGVVDSRMLNWDQPIEGLEMPAALVQEFARRFPVVAVSRMRLMDSTPPTVEAARFHDQLPTILPAGWKVYRQGLAFEFRGPHGPTEATKNDEARITFWFSLAYAGSDTLSSRDETLPRIGSWGNTRLGQVLFTRNRAAIENWPGFLDDVYWILPVEHVAFVGKIDERVQIEDSSSIPVIPSSLLDILYCAGTRIDTRIDAEGRRIDYLAIDHFRKKTEEYSIAPETQLVVVGELPDPDSAKTETDRQHAIRQHEQLARMKEGAAKYGARVITLAEYVDHLRQLKWDGFGNPWPEVKDGNSIEVPVVAVPPVERGAGVPVSADRPQGLSARDDEPARRLGTLTGRFLYDGERPARKDLFPHLSRIDASRPQQPGPDGRLGGVEATYRDFLKHDIRPSTLDPSLLVDETGGIANVVVWVTSKDVPWTPPLDLAQRPVTIRLKDGNFTPRMTVATVGQPVVVENLDPVPFGFHPTFRDNSDINALLLPVADAKPFRWTGIRAEPFPARYRSDQGIWADGWLFVAANPYVAVSGEDGTFALPDLPPGEWEFRVWHERRGYLQHWPKGVFRQTIEPGQNDLGVIRLKPEQFAERVVDASTK